jgi:hypothetical protein
MKYGNKMRIEHRINIRERQKFDSSYSFHRKNISMGVDRLIGKLKSNSKCANIAYIFNTDLFTVDEVRKWIKKHTKFKIK